MLRNLNLLWALITCNKTLINPLKHKYKFQRKLPSTIIFFISGFKVTRLLKSIAIAWRNLWLTPIVPHKNKDIVTKLCYWPFDGPLRSISARNNKQFPNKPSKRLTRFNTTVHETSHPFNVLILDQ